MPRRYRRRFRKKPKESALVRAGKFAWRNRSTAAAAMALALKTARMINVEIKNFDHTNTNATINTAGFIQNLFTPAQGTLSNERDGDSSKILRVSGRLVFQMNNSATKTQIRVILFRGKQENSNPYGMGDVLETVSVVSPKNYHDRFRTKIIYDKLYHLSNNGNSNLALDYNFKLYGHVNFENGTQDIENGGLYILFLSNEPTNVPTLTSYLRTTFTDN